jgi:hypothetical protein
MGYTPIATPAIPYTTACANTNTDVQLNFGTKLQKEARLKVHKPWSCSLQSSLKQQKAS